jgi:hypothetical protein
MENLTEIPDKLTRLEFEELYARALSRFREHEKRTAVKSAKVLDKETIRPYAEISRKV